MIEAITSDIEKLNMIGTGKRISFSEKYTTNILNTLYTIVSEIRDIKYSCKDTSETKEILLPIKPGSFSKLHFNRNTNNIGVVIVVKMLPQSVKIFAS